jgi:hypothetical protein
MAGNSNQERLIKFQIRALALIDGDPGLHPIDKPLMW